MIKQISEKSKANMSRILSICLALAIAGGVYWWVAAGAQQGEAFALADNEVYAAQNLQLAFTVVERLENSAHLQAVGCGGPGFRIHFSLLCVHVDPGIKNPAYHRAATQFRRP